MTNEALEPHVKDSWDPEPEDPFWMLEAEDGEWLKNARSMLGTRDASKAIRFPTQQDAYDHPARMTPGYKWWAAIPTEHTWIDTRPPNPLQAEITTIATRCEQLEVERISNRHLIREREAEVAALRARLEMVPGWSEDADGIACRNDTIALQDARIEKLRARVEELENLLSLCTSELFLLTTKLTINDDQQELLRLIIAALKQEPTP